MPSQQLNKWCSNLHASTILYCCGVLYLTIVGPLSCWHLMMTDRNAERERGVDEDISDSEAVEKDSNLIEGDTTHPHQSLPGFSQHQRVEREIRKGFPGFDTLRCWIVTTEGEQNLLQAIRENLINGTTSEVVPKSKFEQTLEKYSVPSLDTLSLVQQAGAFVEIDGVMKQSHRLIVVPDIQMTEFLSESVNIRSNQTGGALKPPIDTVFRRRLAFLGSEYSHIEDVQKGELRAITSKIYAEITSILDKEIEALSLDVTLFGRRKDNESEIRMLENNAYFDSQSSTETTSWYKSRFLPFLGQAYDSQNFPMALKSDRQRYNEYLTIIDVHFDLNSEFSVEDVIPEIDYICEDEIETILRKITSIHDLDFPDDIPETFARPTSSNVPRWYRGGDLVKHIKETGDAEYEMDHSNLEHMFRFSSMFQYKLESVQ